MKRETEIGGIQPQATECRGLLAATAGWKEPRPESLQQGPANTLILDF